MVDPTNPTPMDPTNAAPSAVQASPDVTQIMQGFPPQMAAAMRAKIANDQATEQAIIAHQNEESALRQKMIAERPPSLEGLQTAFAAPPPAPSIEPIKAFQNFGTVLALLGSMLTRAPLTSAFRVAGAAMSAHTQSQFREYALKRQEWRDNVDMAMKQNELELQKYQAARDTYADDMSKMTAEIASIASQNKDDLTLNMLRNGEYDQMFDLWAKREEMQARFAQAMMMSRMRYGRMSAAQMLHDQKIRDAQERLKSVYGIDYNDPKGLASVYSDVQNNGGFVTPEQREKISLYKLAQEPEYGEMLSVPGLGETAQPTPLTASDKNWPPGSQPLPPGYDKAPDGTQVPGSDGINYQKKGDHLEPIELQNPGEQPSGSVDLQNPGDLTSSAPGINIQSILKRVGRP